MEPVKKKQKTTATDGKGGGGGGGGEGEGDGLPEYYESLLEACQRGTSEPEVRSLLRQGGVEGLAVDQADERGRTALMWACDHGHDLGVVRLLLTQGNAAINQADGGGATALYIASEKGHVGVVRYLVTDAHAAVNQADNTGFTPLHVAADRGFFGVVRFLACSRARLTQLDSAVWQNEQVFRALVQGCQDRLCPLLFTRLEDTLASVLPLWGGGEEPVLLPMVLEYALPFTWEDVQEELR